MAENYNLTQTGAEVQALLDKVDALPTNTELTASLTTLQGNIDAEETARENADTTLQGNIDAEETARENADTTLQGNIDAEETARENADSGLQEQITLSADVTPQAIAELYAAVVGLAANLKNLGTAKAETIDFKNMPLVCGQSLVVEGSGAPSVVPMFKGQRYHDTTNKKVYEAFSVTNSTADWVLLN